MKKLYLLLCLVLGSCTGVPEGLQPVQDFNIKRYLGTWYEIARLDHSFEQGLSRVTAEYSLAGDGSVSVINRGYSKKNMKWKSAEGKARFVGAADLGHLMVSFFGPFYGAYVIVELDHEGYQYALVCGPDMSYLWLLARQPDLDTTIRDTLVEQAKKYGFAVDALIYMDHE